MAEDVTATIDLAEPITTASGRVVRSLTVREPTAGDYVKTGPVLLKKRRAKLTVSFEMHEMVAAYLRRGLVGLASHEVDEVLAILPLADTFRLVRAFSPMVPRIDTREVRFFQTILAFDWHAMSIREADAMGIDELLYTVERLGEHSKRRSEQRSKR